MKKEMLINVLQAEECRIAIIEDGVLEELYIERSSHETYTGNIYKGRVVNLEPAIQAAFVDFSIGRNGFLHVSDVEPRYFSRLAGTSAGEGEGQGRERGRDGRRGGPGRSGPGRGEGRPSSRDTRRPMPATQATTDFDFGADLATGAAEFGGGLDEFGLSDANPALSGETSMPSSAPRNPESRRGDRDRGRRGGRDRGGRSPRGPRDRSYRGPRQPLPADDDFATGLPDPLAGADQTPFYAEPEFGSNVELEAATDLGTTETPQALFDTDIDLPTPPLTTFGEELFTEEPKSQFEPEIIAPSPVFEKQVEPKPEVVYEEPKVAPPPQPIRPRRGFGVGLEDWDTGLQPSARKPFVAPIKPVVPEIPAAVVTPAAEKPPAPEPARPVSTVTRAISPAPPAAPRPKSRFGSGLLEDSEPEAAPTRIEPAAFFDRPVIIPPIEPPFAVDEPVTDLPAPAPVAQSAVSITEIEATVETFGSGLVQESAEATAPLTSPDDLSSSGLSSEAAEEAPKQRGRRRSTTGSGRGRGRTSRPAAEAEVEAALPEVEAVAQELDTVVSDSEGAGLQGASEIVTDEAPSERRPTGRDMIRARGGDRQPIGPRAEIPEHLWNLTPAEPDQTESGEDSEDPRSSGGRYVPRLERERRRGRGGRRPRPSSEFEGLESSGVEPADDDLTPEGDLSADAEGIETAGDDDPRLGQRSGFAKGRRRRRRRRPGMREQGQPTGAEPVEFDPLAPEAEGESGQPLGDWSELDWSASPPGAAEALAEDGLAEDAEPGDEESAGRPARARRFRKTGGRRPRRGGRHQSEIGPAPGEDFGDEMDDDSESTAESYVPDPNDIVEPELQEEIRREAEEIEAMEIELGIRQPGEIRESLRGGRGPYKPPIQEIFQRNDEVLVQVIKESLGTKGPTLSTYISIPGRYLVLMPGLQRVGVSRKIGDDSQRRRLRDKMNALNPPKGLGFIVRTAGVDRSKRELARDLAYLLRLWKTILRRIKRTRSPAPIYQESDMIIRTIRDIFTGEIDTIWIDEQSAFERAQEFLKNVMPKYVDRLKLYGDRTPLFHKYGIEDEIARIGQRHVPLPDGGSIVIDQTEALVAIDVNSGSFRADDDAERNAYEMNLRAAREIGRQLRLRDLGGVIVNDFIDMRDERHRRGVERALRDAIRRDRARTKILRMSQFGLIEMTRQRIRPSLKRSIYEDCPNCLAQGVVKTPESMSIDVMRILAMAANRQDIRRINITCSQNVANFLNNRKRQDLARIERDGHLTIHIRPEADVAAEFLQVDGFGNYNTEIRLYPTQAMVSHRRVPNTTGVGPSSGQHHSHGHSHSRGHDHGHGQSR